MKTEQQQDDERLQLGVAEIAKNLAAEGQTSRAEGIARLLDRFSALSQQTRTLDARVLERLQELEHTHGMAPDSCVMCNEEREIHLFVERLGLNVADLTKP